ncbi:hypothetical protein MUP77_02990 [Candidatus Bathyarchaeota archaeon]|nr:hypothetical protein [Candidatus Bathyarchaeota archaeon]
MALPQKVRNTSPNWLNFLWTQLATIQSYRSQGEPDYALAVAIQIVDAMPDDWKEKFKYFTGNVKTTMRMISTGQLKELRQETDIFMKYCRKRKMLRSMSESLVSDFMRQLSHEMDEKGYFEIKQDYEQGFDRTFFQNFPKGKG